MALRFNRNEFTPYEVSVVNYLIHIAENNPGLDWHQIDTTFLDSYMIRGGEPLWKTTYYTVRKQLRANPMDINGYSITPKWLKELFVEYRQGLNKDLWTPNNMCLETTGKIKREDIAIQEDKPKKIYKWEFAYSTNDNILHVVKFPEDATDDYIDGFLKGAGATKLYKIVKEVIREC